MTRATSIRRATLDDADEVAAVVRGLGSENTALPAAFAEPDRAREWIRRVGEEGIIVIAFEGSIPVAFGAIDYNTTEPETALLGVWVVPEHRRKGLATAVAEGLVDYARDRGYRRIRGRLPDGNEPALSFLSSIGAMVPLRNPDMTFELPL